MSFRMHSGWTAQTIGSLASLAGASTRSSSKKRSQPLSSPHDAGVQYGPLWLGCAYEPVGQASVAGITMSARAGASRAISAARTAMARGAIGRRDDMEGR